MTSALTLEQIYPPFGLRIVCGPLDLRPIRDEDIAPLVNLALGGIHDETVMPFSHPWTDTPVGELPRATAAYYWGQRESFTPAAWDLNFVVRHEGVVVGAQALIANDFLVTGSVETGSWLGRAHQGRGIGTAMRRAVCALAFDQLGAVEITSGVFTDNRASREVGRRVGYVEDGRRRVERRPGELAVLLRTVLTPEAFVRGEHPVVVSGVAAFRRFVGLPGEVGEQRP